MDSTVETAVNEIRLYVPGCPRPLILDRLEKAVSAFLVETEAVTCELNTIETVEDSSEYTLILPSGWDGYKVSSVRYIFKDGVRMVPTRDYIVDGTTLILRHVPTENDEGEELHIVVVVDLDSLDDASLTPVAQWLSDGIRGHAVHALATMPKRPWTDFETAALAKREYYEAVTDALFRVRAHRLSI